MKQIAKVTLYDNDYGCKHDIKLYLSEDDNTITVKVDGSTYASTLTRSEAENTIHEMLQMYHLEFVPVLIEEKHMAAVDFIWNRH